MKKPDLFEFCRGDAPLIKVLLVRVLAFSQCSTDNKCINGIDFTTNYEKLAKYSTPLVFVVCRLDVDMNKTFISSYNQ